MTHAKPKPLIRLLGVPLIERVILTAKEAGINEFIIVVGFLGEQIKEVLGDGRKYGIKIVYVENEDWEKGNGISVFKARKYLQETFILLMSDHILDYQILEGIINYESSNDIVLGIDRREPLKTNTKVLEKNGQIIEIGKELENSNCIDTGIFRCTPKVFAFIEEAIKENKTELVDAIAVGSEKGHVGIFDISTAVSYDSVISEDIDAWWIDVDTKEDLKNSRKMLCQQLKKPTDGVISRFINRPMSIQISKLLVRTSISPNMISFFCFAVAILASVFLSFPAYWALIIGGILAQITSILDGCDGEVARLKFQSSTFGGWLDSILDRYADGFFIFGLSLGLWFRTENYWGWIVGFFALIGSFLNSYSSTKFEEFVNKQMGFFQFLVRRDLRIIIILLGSLFNQIFWTLFILGVIMNLEVLRRIIVTSLIYSKD